MMGFSIGKNGRLPVQSNFFDYRFVMTSYELPVSQGKGFNALDTASTEVLSRAYNWHAILEYITNKENATRESFQEWVDLLNDLSDKQSINLQNFYNENPAALNIIAEAVNKYFMDKINDSDQLLEATKNMAISALYKISTSPVNVLGSNRPVDMNAPSRVAGRSPKSFASMQWSMDNYSTLPMMKEQNNAGRESIGISAVGIKTFTAISHVTNKKIKAYETRISSLSTDEKFDYDAQIGYIMNMYDQYQQTGDVRFLDNGNKMLTEVMRKYGADKILTNKRGSEIRLVDDAGNERVKTVLLIANTNLNTSPEFKAIYELLVRHLKFADPEIDLVDVEAQDDVSLDLSALVSCATD